MKVMQIYPTNVDELPEDSRRLSWTYLHGQLETDAGFDIYNIGDSIWDFTKNDDGAFLEANIPQGIYECEYNGKLCLLYFWYSSRRQHGLVVYKDDLSSNEYALKCYNNKESCI